MKPAKATKEIAACAMVAYGALNIKSPLQVLEGN